MIQLQHLCKTFRTADGTVDALQDIDLAVRHREKPVDGLPAQTSIAGQFG